MRLKPQNHVDTVAQLRSKTKSVSHFVTLLLIIRLIFELIRLIFEYWKLFESIAWLQSMACKICMSFMKLKTIKMLDR